MVEPVEHGGKANEAVKGDREFFVTGCDAAVALDPAEEIFDHMTVPVQFAVEVDRRTPAAAGRYAGECAGTGEIPAEAIRIEAAIRDRPFPFQTRLKRCAGPEIMLLSWRQMQTDCSPDTVHHGCELGVETALGAPHGLVRLPADRIRGVSVHFDVGAIDTPDLSERPAGDGIEQSRPQARRTPASESGINRVPWTKAGRQIPPWDTTSQDVPDAGDHESIVFRGPAAAVATVPICQARVSRLLILIFLAGAKLAPATPAGV